MKYIIGIDIGTSGTKGVMFDTDGNIVSSHTAEYPMLQPENGWAEENPTDWWNGTVEVLKELSKSAKDGEIASIGLSGQMHSLVMLDEDCNVIRPAILWCDTRTSEQCKNIEEIIGAERLVEITGNKAVPALTASKILWVREHEHENFAKCRHILLAKDYIRFKLTGEFATEPSDASGMQLLDINTRNWSSEICEKLCIDISLLCKVYESADITGYVTDEVSTLCNIPKGIPVAGGGGDNACAAIGCGVYKQGDAFTTIGTSGVIFAPMDEPKVDTYGRVNTFCAAVKGSWHALGVAQASGLSLNWFRKTFAEDKTYRGLDEMCESIPIGSEKLIYLPYLMGDRTPILDANARGVFFGISALHTKSHFTRSVIEGISFSLYSCLEVLEQMNIKCDSMILCGGGGKSKLWQKMISDVYGTEIKTLMNEESAALGAALLGGVSAGIYSDIQTACEKTVKSKSKTQPDTSNHDSYMKYYSVYKALYPCLKEQYKHLSEL